MDNYCYKSYLPNLHNAPRYIRHQFQRHRPIVAAIANGYTNGYTQGDATLRDRLSQEYFLWGIDVAAENLQRLVSDMNEETYLRAGDKKTIVARLKTCLEELEAHQLD